MLGALVVKPSVVTVDYEAQASLDLSGETSTPVDITVAATPLGHLGNAVSLTLAADGDGTGSITRVGSALTFHFEDGVTKFSDFQSAIAALVGADKLIAVDTVSATGSATFATADAMTETYLSGGVTADGLLSHVGDRAVVDVRDLDKVGILINHLADNLEQTNGDRADLDLGTIGAGAINLDTVVEARLAGLSGNDIDVESVNDLTVLTKAELDVATFTDTAGIDTVLEAKDGGLEGNALRLAFAASGTGVGTLSRVGNLFTFEFENDVTTLQNFETAVAALAGANDLIEVKTSGTVATKFLTADASVDPGEFEGGLDEAENDVEISEVGTVVTIHFKVGATVLEVEEAIDADSELIRVKTPGTSFATLVAVGDEFAAEDLAGGLNGEGEFDILLESSIDGVNFAPIATVDEGDYGDGNNLTFEASFVDSNGMAKRAVQIRATVVALDDPTDKFSLTVVGEAAR